MSEIQSVAVMAQGVNRDPVFAAGMEAAVVMKMLSRGEETVMDGGVDKIPLLTLNREVYRSFAEAFGYRHVLFMNTSADRDCWRFTKKGDGNTEIGAGVIPFAQKVLDGINNKE